MVSVILGSDAEEKDAVELLARCRTYSFVKKATLISREQGRKELEQMLGKDFLDVFATSPIPISLDLNLSSGYFSKDSLDKVKNLLSADKRVREVTYQESLVEAMNSNLDTIVLVVAGIIALLLILLVYIIYSGLSIEPSM